MQRHLHQIVRSRSVLVAGMLISISTSALAETNWPHFRGARFDNNFRGEPPPAVFGPGTNQKWKVSIPTGHSSLIATRDRLFLTAFDGKTTLETIALSQDDGSVLWRRALKPERLEAYVAKFNNPAASTCAMDGERVVSYFGSFGLICHDREGKELWRHRMPLPETRDGFGTGSSPIVHDGKVYLLRDEDGPGQGLYAFDTRTGKEVWRRKRDGFRLSFGSPVIWDGCVVTTGDLRLKAYDAATGTDRWVLRGLPACPCTTPAPGPDGNLYVAVWSNGSGNEPNIPPWEKLLEMMDKDKDGKLSKADCEGTFLGDLFSPNDHDHNGFIEGQEWKANLARMFEGRNAVLALKPGGKGDVTETHVLWRNDKGAPYVASPLLHDGLLYLVKDGGLLTVYEGSSGKVLADRERLGADGEFYASPVAAGGKIYAVSKKGEFFCIKPGPQPAVEWKTDFGESIVTSPIVINGTVFLRSENHVWAFAGK